VLPPCRSSTVVDELVVNGRDEEARVKPWQKAV
jgi:hypothetical protein